LIKTRKEYLRNTLIYYKAKKFNDKMRKEVKKDLQDFKFL
jgi:hypothetical protein